MTNRTNNRPGGLALGAKLAPLSCPKCGKEYPFQTPWMHHLGHLGLHGLADRYFAGNLVATQKHLRENGMARLDPAPWNGAWPRYKKLPAPDKNGRAANPGPALSLVPMLPPVKVQS